jgi:hypothetical protein
MIDRPTKEFVAWVEPAGAHDRKIKLHVMVPRAMAEAIYRYTQANGLHALRWYRDAFALGIVTHLPPAAMPAALTEDRSGRPGTSAASPAAYPDQPSLVDHWRQLEAAFRAEEATRSDPPGGSEVGGSILSR